MSARSAPPRTRLPSLLADRSASVRRRYTPNGIGERQPDEYAACSVHDRLALSVLNMSDAVFKAYGGAGYVHSSGGGLLHPADFHGMAALLVKERTHGGADGPEIGGGGSRSVQRRALRRLVDLYHGNPIVRKTLTCLEREIDGALPTIEEQDSSDDSSSDEDSGGEGNDANAMNMNPARRRRLAGTRAGSRLAQPPTFIGAAVSMLPPGQAADHMRVRQEQTIGDKQTVSGHRHVQPAATDDPKTSPDNAAHTTLLSGGVGGYAETENACSRKHYRQKMLGSVCHVYRRAPEFIWYHFQLMVKRSLHMSAPRVMNATVAMNADGEIVSEHHERLRDLWRDLKDKCAAPLSSSNRSERANHH